MGWALRPLPAPNLRAVPASQMGALPGLENHPQEWQGEARSLQALAAFQLRLAEAGHYLDLGPLLRAEKNLARRLGRA